MKFSLVSLRRTPGRLPAIPPHPTGALPLPSPVHAAPVQPVSLPPCPATLSGGTWELLGAHVLDAQRRSSIAFTALRAVVQSAVRELRLNGESWDGVYAALNSAVVAVPGGPSEWAREYEMHTSRSAALVAHMQSWADVERLAELEGEGLGA